MPVINLSYPFRPHVDWATSIRCEPRQEFVIHNYLGIAGDLTIFYLYGPRIETKNFKQTCKIAAWSCSYVHTPFHGRWRWYLIKVENQPVTSFWCPRKDSSSFIALMSYSWNADRRQTGIIINNQKEFNWIKSRAVRSWSTLIFWSFEAVSTQLPFSFHLTQRTVFLCPWLQITRTPQKIYQVKHKS